MNLYIYLYISKYLDLAISNLSLYLIYLSIKYVYNSRKAATSHTPNEMEEKPTEFFNHLYCH